MQKEKRKNEIEIKKKKQINRIKKNETVLYMHSKVLFVCKPWSRKEGVLCLSDIRSSPDVGFLFKRGASWGDWRRDKGSLLPYCGDFGGVWWGSLLGVFPGCGGGEAHRPAGLRFSLAGLTVRPSLEEGGYVSLALASVWLEVSGHFLSSPAEAVQGGLASFGVWGCCDVGVSFTRWQISAYEGFLSSWKDDTLRHSGIHAFISYCHSRQLKRQQWVQL